MYERAFGVRMFDFPRARNLILLVALVCFTGGLAISLQHQPQTLDKLDWRLIAIIVLIGIPITLALNAFEFVLAAKLIGQRITFFQALYQATELVTL